MHTTKKHRTSRHCVIYFIQAGAEGPIKIGITRSLHERFHSLRCANYEKLNIIGVLYDSNFNKERELHKRFSFANIQGEWFTPHSELIEYIRNNTNEWPEKPITKNTVKPKRIKVPKPPAPAAHDAKILPYALRPKSMHSPPSPPPETATKDQIRYYIRERALYRTRYGLR